MNPIKADLFIKNVAQLATPISNSEYAPAGLLTINNAGIAAHEGDIIAVGKVDEVQASIHLTRDAIVLDADEMLLTPGFVDCHTHLVYYGTRENEFAMRLSGKSYEDIARAGGGIRSTVRNLRKASKEQLIKQALIHLDTFLAFGTTTIEAKSGYGLSVADEIKILEVIAVLKKMHPVDIIPTFLGAHEIPDEYRQNRSEYIRVVVDEMLPLIQKKKLAEFCDIFCESHVFSVDESRHILEAAKSLGFNLKIHSEQLSRNGGTAMAAQLGATSADHLDYTEPEDWQLLRQNKVIPVLLPGAVYFLGKNKYVNAREMIKSGLPVAIATDFNPGSCMTESMQMIINLAALKMHLTAEEALIAATYHAALAVNRGNLLGLLEVGKRADFVLWNVQNYKQIPYHFGVNLVNMVIKSGKIVYRDHNQITYN